MRKFWLLPFILLLAACSAGGGAPTEDQRSIESDQSSSDETSVDSGPVEPLDNDITIGQNAAQASVVRDRDWAIGADDPLVTIIEYGDFQ